jgi:hypothetical protein
VDPFPDPLLCIHMAQSWAQWWELVNVVIKLRLTWKAQNVTEWLLACRKGFFPIELMTWCSRVNCKAVRFVRSYSVLQREQIVECGCCGRTDNKMMCSSSFVHRLWLMVQKPVAGTNNASVLLLTISAVTVAQNLHCISCSRPPSHRGRTAQVTIKSSLRLIPSYRYRTMFAASAPFLRLLLLLGWRQIYVTDHSDKYVIPQIKRIQMIFRLFKTILSKTLNNIKCCIHLDYSEKINSASGPFTWINCYRYLELHKYGERIVEMQLKFSLELVK